MKISVIILTYNRLPLVSTAIDSLLAQTVTNFELILVDNGATDGTNRLLDRYASQDKRIKVIHKKKGNIGSGRNAGLSLATGDYITFVDDDDWVSADFLDHLSQLALSHSSDISICNMSTLVGSPIHIDSPITIMTPENALITLLWRKHFSTGFPAKLIKRNLFNNIFFSEKDRYDDLPILYKIIGKCNRVVYSIESKYNVLRHDTNNSIITTNDRLITPDYIVEYYNAYRERTAWLCENFPYNRDYWLYFNWSFLISMVNKISTNHLIDCNKHMLHIIKELTKHKNEFLVSKYLQPYEKIWIDKYL